MYYWYVGVPPNFLVVTAALLRLRGCVVVVHGGGGVDHEKLRPWKERCDDAVVLFLLAFSLPLCSFCVVRVLCRFLACCK